MRDAWYPLLLSEELEQARVRPAKLFGDPLVLFRQADGRPACFLDNCPHRSIPLSLGRVVAGRLECSYHGWQYEGGGRCVRIPLLPAGQCIPRSAVARAYPSVERHGVIWVWPGEPSRADLALLPLPSPDCDGSSQTHLITTYFESRYDLVIDHGLDMPHFFQIHARTLGLVLREFRLSAPLDAGRPRLDGIDESEDTFAVRWRLARPGGEALVTTKVFHPCNVFTALPLDLAGTRSLQHVFCFTPVDERRTRGFLFAHRNFLRQPVIGHAFDRLYEWMMARARGEDDAVFQGQLSNEALGARSTTGWPYDVVSSRYFKWQGRRSGQDLWFKDFEHARRRYPSEGPALSAEQPSAAPAVSRGRPAPLLERAREACWSVRNVWSPENFHYHDLHRQPSHRFEGWYFKVVDAAERNPYALIAGVSLGEDRHAFVQVLDGQAGRSWYHRFDLREFSASRRRFDVRIGRSRFHAGGIELDLERSDLKAEHVMKGRLSFGPWSAWPSSLLSPGAMGPYSFLPFLECNHGLLSLDHELRGWLEVEGRQVSYEGGRGYLEKDWGSSFPKGHLWWQSNHFDKPGIAISGAVATSPVLSVDFRGFIVGFLFEGKIHCFRAYLGATLEALEVSDTRIQLCLRNQTHRLRLEAKRSEGTLLLAPYEGKMRERVAESMNSTLKVHFSTREGADLYVGTGRNACIEVQGEFPLLTNARRSMWS